MKTELKVPTYGKTLYTQELEQRYRGLSHSYDRLKRDYETLQEQYDRLEYDFLRLSKFKMKDVMEVIPSRYFDKT